MEQTFLYGYRTEIENSSDNRYKYIGLASCDADEEDSTWQIRRIELNQSGNVQSIKYANGNQRFNCKWSERENLTYK